MKKYIIVIMAIAITLLLNSCGNKNTATEHGEEQHDEHENASTATLTAEQIKSIGIELGAMEKKQLTASLKANGLLKVPNQNKASATATYGGVVKTILVQPGNTVSKGQVLATISNALFISIQEEFLSTSAKADLAQADFERQLTLKEGNAASQKTFQQAEAELKSPKECRIEPIAFKSKKSGSENLHFSSNKDDLSTSVSILEISRLIFSCVKLSNFS